MAPYKVELKAESRKPNPIRVYNISGGSTF